MRKFATSLLALALCAAFAGSAFAASQVRISQVYGGGGASSGSPAYAQDYVELYNSGTSAVNIGGWAIEYGSATGAWGSSAVNIFAFPAGTTIQPCGYILVAAPGTNSAGTAFTGGTLPVTPDFNGVAFPTASGPQLSMSATTGKVALFNTTNANVACGSEVGLQDKVAYGPTATCAETSPTAVLANTSGDVRNGAGATDTDNNASDFTVITTPIPHNSSSPLNPICTPTPTNSQTWGKVKVLYR